MRHIRDQFAEPIAADLNGRVSTRSQKKNGAPEEIRTPDPQIRSLVLYPAELRARLAHRAGSVPGKATGNACVAIGFASQWQVPRPFRGAPPISGLPETR